MSIFHPFGNLDFVVALASAHSVDYEVTFTPTKGAPQVLASTILGPSLHQGQLFLSGPGRIDWMFDFAGEQSSPYLAKVIVRNFDPRGATSKFLEPDLTLQGVIDSGGRALKTISWDVVDDSGIARLINPGIISPSLPSLAFGLELTGKTPSNADPRVLGEGSDTPPQNREITVTGHFANGLPVSQFNVGTAYLLRFRVGPPVKKNLADGNTAVTDIPSGGLETHWILMSASAQFGSSSPSIKVHKVDDTWIAEFDLLIPERGSSATEELGMTLGTDPGSVLVTIYAVAGDGAREIYREVSVSLSGAPKVTLDEVCKAPQHTHLNTTHEWTTAPEGIEIKINKNGVATVTTKRILLRNYDVSETFAGTSALIAGAIQHARDSLEKFREAHQAYLNELDPTEMAARLRSGADWQPYFPRANGWQPLPSAADASHASAFERVRESPEWRDLASDGYALFERCFPTGTKIRGVLENLLPGSRIDFHWTAESGPGLVSHVPWPLMYMEPVDLTGRTLPDPEKFLGLRFRVGTCAWSVSNDSVALGALDATHSMHLMYWGDKPGDEVAVEAQWQVQEYAKWKQCTLVPDAKQSEPKKQIMLALDDPAPAPVGVVYFYCHCSVGDGSEPYLRFGNTSKREDALARTELSQRRMADAPMVFANACTTAQSDPYMASELEQAFFQRGVRAFIGTETKVPIQLASKFAWLYFQFFFRVVDPEPMAAGEAMTQARLFLWTQFKNVGGLFYSIVNQYDLCLASNEEVVRLRRV